ncbi:hypothetical protein ACOME3_003024 [Neoechinorhynchus agilis]
MNVMNKKKSRTPSQWVLMAALLAAVIIGSIIYIGGTVSASYFRSSLSGNCSVNARSIGLFRHCLTDLFVENVGTATVIVEDHQCAHHSTLNRDARTSQALWGFWFILFMLLIITTILTIIVWKSRRITIARKMSLIAAVIALLTLIFLVVSFAYFTNAVNRSRFLMARRCAYGSGFVAAVIGFIIAAIALIGLTFVLGLTGLSELRK